MGQPGRRVRHGIVRRVDGLDGEVEEEGRAWVVRGNRLQAGLAIQCGAVRVRVALGVVVLGWCGLGPWRGELQYKHHAAPHVTLSQSK